MIRQNAKSTSRLKFSNVIFAIFIQFYGIEKTKFVFSTSLLETQKPFLFMGFNEVFLCHCLQHT